MIEKGTSLWVKCVPFSFYLKFTRMKNILLLILATFIFSCNEPEKEVLTKTEAEKLPPKVIVKPRLTLKYQYKITGIYYVEYFSIIKVDSMEYLVSSNGGITPLK